MPLDLGIDVNVRTGNAKSELREVEQAIKGVESAAAKTEAPIAGVARALIGTSTAAKHVEETSRKMTGTLSAESQAWLKAQNAITLARNAQMDATVAARVAAEQTGTLTTQTVALTAARTAGTVALNPLIAATVALAVVGAAELKFLYDSAQLYIEKSGILAKHQDEIDGVKDAWEDMKYNVGMALVGNNADVQIWIRGIETGIRYLSGVLTYFTLKFRADLNWAASTAMSLAQFIPGMGNVGALIGAAASATPRPDTNLPNDPFTASPFNPSGDPSVEGQTLWYLQNGGIGGQFLNFANQEAPQAIRNATIGRERQRQKIEAEAWLEGLQASVTATMLYPGQTIQQWLASTSISPEDYAGVPWMMPEGPNATTGLGGTQFGTPLGPGAWGIPGMPASPQGSFSSQVMQGGPYQYQNSAGNISGLSQGMNIGAFALGTLGQVGVGGAVMEEATSTLSLMATGAMLGSVLPGLGTAAGAAIGAAIGGVKALIRALGPTEYEKEAKQAAAELNAMRTALFENFGGYQGASFLASQLGINLAGTTGWSGPGGAEAMRGVIEDIAAGATRGLNEILSAALTTGAEFPKALGPAMEELIRMGTITEENANLLLGLPAAGVPSFAEITEAAKLLNIEIDKLGPAVQQIKLTEEADKAVEAMGILKDAGVDTGVIMVQSAGHVQGLVTRSIEMGLLLPDSLKPFVRDMIAAGLLVDDTGEKLTDVGQLKWSDPVKEGMDELISALRELIGLMKDDLPSAARTARDEWNDAVATTKPFPSPFIGVAEGEPDPGGGYPGGGAPYHMGGYLSPWRVAHSGGLGPDEFRMIGQTGEYMHRRSAVQKYGRGFMDAVNSGSYEPGRSWPLEIVMKATFATPDFKVIAEGVARETLQ